MARYTQTPVIKTSDNPNRRYTLTKYPEIPLDFSDVYVYVTKGDRYDILANVYYNDHSLWWVISNANPTLPQDSLIPPPGSQIRIPSPSRLASILGAYESLNKNI